jgi:hypothetical protein
VHVYGYCRICFETLSGFDHPVGFLYNKMAVICFETVPGFVSPNYPIILHSFSLLILNITRIRWSTAFLQLLNFVCLLEFGFFTAFSLPASFFSKFFVFAKVLAEIFAKVFAKTFVIFVTLRKLFPRKAKQNMKTKIFASTLSSMQ